jgi:iron(III) transport system permease protein
VTRAAGVLWLVPLAAFAGEAALGAGGFGPAWLPWGNTLAMAGTCAALATLLGVPAAAALAHAPRLAPLIFAPLALPPVVAASAWMGLRLPAPGAFSCGAILAATLWPLPALLGWAALRRVPRAEIEAAALHGAPLLRVVWPHARPAVAAGALLVFLLAASEFTVPAAFAIPTVGTRVYEHLYAFNVREAAATSLPLLALAGAAAVALRRVPAFPRPGAPAAFLEPAASAAVKGVALAASALTALAPAAAFAWTLKTPAAYGRAMATDGEGLLWGAFFAGATAAVLTAWASAARGRSRLEPLWVASLVLPGMVPALGVLALGLPAGSGWLFVWALAARFAAVAWLPARDAVEPAQLEAAALAGLSRGRIWRRVVLPAVWPRAAAAGAAVFALALGEVGPAVLLAPPGRQTGVQRLFNALHYGYDNTAAALALSLVAGAAALAWLGVYAGRVARPEIGR